MKRINYILIIMSMLSLAGCDYKMKYGHDMEGSTKELMKKITLGLNEENVYNESGMLDLYNLYLKKIAESPRSQGVYCLLNDGIPLLAEKLTGYIPKNMLTESEDGRLNHINEDKLDFIICLKRIIDSSNGDRAISAKILLAELRMKCEYLDKNNGLDALKNIINTKEYDIFHQLCFSLIISDRDGVKSFRGDEYEKNVEKYIKQNEEFRFVAETIKFKMEFNSSKILSKNKSVVTKRWFDLAMKQNISSLNYEDNPFPIHEAYVAANLMYESDQKLKSLLIFLGSLNDHNDPKWDNFSYRADTCAGIATIYYDHGDYEKAMMFVKKGKSFGKHVQLDTIQGAVEYENKRNINKPAIKKGESPT